MSLLAAYGDLPLRFEANHGQTDPRVNFISRGSTSALFLTPSSAVLTLDVASSVSKPSQYGPANSPRPDRVALQLSLAGANASAPADGLNPLPGPSNYFVGNDPHNWRTNIPTFAKVRYTGIYPGVDLVYYGNHRALEYDFIVSPAADPRRIRIHVTGARRVSMSRDGAANIETSAGTVSLDRPRIYQLDRGQRTLIAGAYLIAANSDIQFRLGPYDRSRALVIDPVLQYSTFLGGTTSDSANAIAVNSSGNAYITGETSSTDFPVTSGALQTSLHGTKNVFISELNAGGTAVIYSTYLGGLSGNGDSGSAIAIDSSGDAYVTGVTTSASFPVVNPVQAALKSAAGDAFVSELNPSGSALLYSTYLGGSGAVGDSGAGIAVGANGLTYVTGVTTSADFPVLNPLSGQSALKNAVSAAFVTAFNPGGAALAYSTYLGGSGAQGDTGAAIAVDSSGNAYVTGATSSSDFPVTSTAYQTALKGTGFNAFMSEINSAGTAFLYSTFLGGSTSNGGLAFGIALDSSNNVYLTGLTNAPDFPIFPSNAAQTTLTGTGGHAFVSAIAPTSKGAASLLYSTYLGGSNNAAVADVGHGIAVDSNGNANVTGLATSTDFPVTPGAFQSTLLSAAGNAFVTRVNFGGTVFLYSTYLGGSGPNGDSGLGVAVDPTGVAYVAGRTSSVNFPTTTGVLLPHFLAASGQTNGFVTKIAANQVVSIVPSSIDFGNVLLNKSGPAQLVIVTNNSTAPLPLSPAPALTGVNASQFVISSACGTTGAEITLQPGQSCNVTVNFTPVAFGPASASLVFSDPDPGSPQIVPLTGTGYQDFSIAATTPPAVSPGNSETFTVTVTPIDNSTQTIGLACEGVPAGITCTFAPNMLPLDGTDAATAIATVSEATSITSSSSATPGGRSQLGGSALTILFAFIAIVALAISRRRGLRLGFGAAALACLLLFGCSSGPVTPNGTYTLNIVGTATPGGQTHNVTVTLTVTD
ncbi:MAG TPA: SBBP repeat-containing protein [Candidatus Acidoferrales bacterium]|nr:SBBP repeat-containing protein [Candidatus Acidoferrales bacterium]